MQTATALESNRKQTIHCTAGSTSYSGNRWCQFCCRTKVTRWQPWQKASQTVTKIFPTSTHSSGQMWRISEEMYWKQRAVSEKRTHEHTHRPLSSADTTDTMNVVLLLIRQSNINHYTTHANHGSTDGSVMSAVLHKEWRGGELICLTWALLMVRWMCSFMPHIHLSILISAHWSATLFSFLMDQVSLPCNILLCNFAHNCCVSRNQKGKTNLDFTEARDSEWQRYQLGHMQICILPRAQTDNHAITPPLSFLQAGCPSCHHKGLRERLGLDDIISVLQQNRL